MEQTTISRISRYTSNAIYDNSNQGLIGFFFDQPGNTNSLVQTNCWNFRSGWSQLPKPKLRNAIVGNLYLYYFPLKNFSFLFIYPVTVSHSGCVIFLLGKVRFTQWNSVTPIFWFVPALTQFCSFHPCLCILIVQSIIKELKYLFLKFLMDILKGKEVSKF